jgi:multiple sugar transport system ATP-binding protein
MANVVLRGVSKRFGSQEVVRALSLEVRDGELMVLVGPSGCGKSTVLRMIAGLEEVSEGTILLGGRDITHLQPKERDVAMVFQSYALYPHMTVRQNLEFGLKVRGVARPERERMVAGTASMLEIGELLERRPRQLSGGQRQRVAVGRAIVREPSVFLFDEPLSNLDARLRTQTRVEIARLQRQLGTTSIYVTHDQVEAMTLGHRIAVLKDGRLEQVGTPSDLYQRPATTFVATFIGSPSMTLLPARVIGGGLGLDAGVLTLPAVPGLASYGLADGSQVIVGIRPESVRPEGAVAANRAAAVSGEVVVVEPLGAQVHVQLRLGDQLLAAMLPPSTIPRPGEQLTLAIDLGELHLFDEAGRRLAG